MCVCEEADVCIWRGATGRPTKLATMATELELERLDDHMIEKELKEQVCVWVAVVDPVICIWAFAVHLVDWRSKAASKLHFCL